MSNYFSLLSHLFQFPMRILILEDEAIIALDLASMLRSMGIKEIAIFSTAEEGLAWIQKDHPDLIFMDIKLKGSLNGIEAAKRIQAEGPYRLVYVTAYNDENILREAQQTPHLAIIKKPFIDTEIRQVIRDISS